MLLIISRKVIAIKILTFYKLKKTKHNNLLLHSATSLETSWKLRPYFELF